MRKVVHVKKGVPDWYIQNAKTIARIAIRATYLTCGKYGEEDIMDALCFYGIVADADGFDVDWKRMLTDDPTHFSDFIDTIIEVRRNSITVDA